MLLALTFDEFEEGLRKGNYAKFGTVELIKEHNKIILHHAHSVDNALNSYSAHNGIVNIQVLKRTCCVSLLLGATCKGNVQHS